MLFPTHLVAADLLGRRWNLPSYWMVAGAALPDVIDKPLAMAGITERYHSIGHSLPFLVGPSVVTPFGRNGIALWVGWASNLAIDAFQMVINGRPADVRFLRWPLIRHEPAVDMPPVEFALSYVGTPSFYVELLLWAGFCSVLVLDVASSDSRDAP